jgi:hypothetical protein
LKFNKPLGRWGDGELGKLGETSRKREQGSRRAGRKMIGSNSQLAISN